MTLCRLIAPDWLMSKNPQLPRAIEGQFTNEEIKAYNSDGYNIYYFPNSPSSYKAGTTVDGTHIDVFTYAFVDFDLKSGTYPDKDAFYEALAASGIQPTKVVDSGNGVHAYWHITNLDSKSYLHFQARLVRKFNTDPAVGKLLQLMRLPGTVNTKRENTMSLCSTVFEENISYTAEEFNKLLPVLTKDDELKCKRHYDTTFNINQTQVSDAMPPKFGEFLKNNEEAKQLWSSTSDDRSKSDFRLAHLMFANEFTKEEAASVLMNSAKALERAPIHRQTYAGNIVDKIWTFELKPEDADKLDLSDSIEQLKQRSTADNLTGKPFRCHPCIDNTVHGFRLGQVLGLVAGSGVGKTSFALNMFQWFAQRNPEYHHFFIPLEQPANEIADRWTTMCGKDTSLHSKIQVMSNYDKDGNFRNLSLDDIQDYINKYQRVKGVKVGCVVIDHIGVLNKHNRNGEMEGLVDVCHRMKQFAVNTKTFLVMQSQTNRMKAGIGDIELDKDAAYGTMYFEAYVDYLVTMWQPLKRMHSIEGCPTVTAFKFCKIRHKKARKDVIKEDTPYYMYFDSDLERLRDMTEDEEESFKAFLPEALKKRSTEKSSGLVVYQSVPYKQEGKDVNPNTRSFTSS